MSDTTAVLNDVIETLKDGQAGFRDASENVPSPELKTLFSEYSLQRSKFAGELQSLARTTSGEEPANSGSVTGALHRGWIDLKAAIVKRDAHAILVECERGEDVAVDAYRKAVLDTDLPANVTDTLQAQLVEVKAAHDRIKALRDGLSSK